ncbi:hypothetical protein EYF80_043755 [Liparis tanakae]|uniref:Uncharacterized protein n=1 Tax=Liparis tanakae TaxID=230148 RepID=A0A4Z2FXN6_9TELE|nr:hypothetical protein EYF80_043755 [Liparis tanakae]
MKISELSFDVVGGAYAAEARRFYCMAASSSSISIISPVGTRFSRRPCRGFGRRHGVRGHRLPAGGMPGNFRRCLPILHFCWHGHPGCRRNTSWPTGSAVYL